MTGPTRDGNGRFDRDPETAKRDAEACRLRAQNMSYRQIAAELGVDVHTAYDAVQRALRDTLQEPADDVRRLALMRLDEYARHAREVLRNTHYVVSQGRVVRLTRGGTPLEDDMPKLQAIDRLLKIETQVSDLLGLKAPQRVSIDAQNLGEEIRDLIAALVTGDEDEDLDDEEGQADEPGPDGRGDEPA
ncbi:transcriptional regulator with XRE-family HTH domain [Nonomuraea thailandensis]|uniref:Transcriptional regulator with XRE-family HTH domain n=1 Tax=Nonomuraea thailandensis TaxID=1188745 RepID=A0A9X2H1K3_9ACTN|nr:hypothetical protein [Nonomuraea thailandensis]MCP2364273.1 transcriptional regulator with XRE-family HTH domain [Nonomuraea thailandensis]